MGIGKIARGLGKVGMLVEGVGYLVATGRALVKAIKGDPDKPNGSRSDSPGSGDQ
ncbi:hypothetical protein K9B33_20830 [Sphingobium sp. 3R8]|uniref:hypothetical protein n=1 Tax=Sphingobium sp. 3R8 TaxID=2874921 RepID=UPI001CCA02A5|nr:hypothetical protein [Sphingobium sp. 3R8]MBZ9649983.1 hypothetical protein [Sphingobium sp. 3R8]